MTKNICSAADRTVRIILGLGILAAGWYYQNLWGLIGLLPLATVAMSYCPLYSLFGVDTCHLKGRAH